MDHSYAFKLDHIETGKSPIPRDHFPSCPGYSDFFPGMFLIKYGFGNDDYYDCIVRAVGGVRRFECEPPNRQVFGGSKFKIFEENNHVKIYQNLVKS